MNNNTLRIAELTQISNSTQFDMSERKQEFSKYEENQSKKHDNLHKKIDDQKEKIDNLEEKLTVQTNAAASFEERMNKMDVAFNRQFNYLTIKLNQDTVYNH